MQVQGLVTLRNGAANIQFAPVVQHMASAAPQTPRPTLDIVKSWPLHETRLPFEKDQLASAMIVVQKQLSLSVGVLQGEWNDMATERLKTNLAKPKRGAKRPLEEKELLALEDLKKPRSTEHQEPTNQSSSDSGSDSGSNSGSDSGSDESSHSSMSSKSTTKSFLRWENSQLLEAIGCHQRMEEDNEGLLKQIGILTEENLKLHGKLRVAMARCARK